MRAFRVVYCAALILIVSSISSSGFGQKLTATAESASYVSPQGERYFALAVRPQLPADANDACDVLILFDTSASQAGPYRARGLEVLQQLFAALGAEDRVKLMGIDLNAIPLNQQFEQADSAAVKNAVRKLQRRVPLGSTDFDVALRAAAEQFPVAAQKRRAVVYIGDGVKRAAADDEASLKRQIADLADRQISFFAYGIGPKVDATFLSSLAVATGGRFVADQSVAKGTSPGLRIAKLIEEPVAWRPQIHWPAELTQIRPSPLPPLRSGQPLIILGEGTPSSDSQLTIKTVLAGQPTMLRCDVAATKPDGSQAYLVDLHRSAMAGVLPQYFAAQGLHELRGTLSVHGHQFGKLAQNALATGNRPAARRLAQRALRADADNAAAAAVLSVLDRNSVDRTPIVRDGDSDLLDRVRHENQRRTESLRARVNAALNEARRRMSSEPGQVEAELKALLDSLQSAIDVDSDMRMGLADQTKSAIRAARRMEITAAERTREAMEIQAQQVARRDLIDNAARDQDKTAQLMERFNSLMDDGRHREAFDVAYNAALITSGDAAIAAASLTAVRSQLFEETMAIRRQRQYGTALALLDVERAAIPLPGDSPIVYPDAETWDALSRRRAQFSSLDMHRRGRVEQEILLQLNEPTRIDFEETPLQEVVDYLSEYHNIKVVLDHHALGELALGANTRVTFRVGGISLRSALRLILRRIDPALAFTVQDEVLLISTKEELENHLTTRNYPVADLVLPIQDLNFAGLGGFSQNGLSQGFGSDAFGPQKQNANANQPNNPFPPDFGF